MEIAEAIQVLTSLPEYQDLVSKECEAIDTVIAELNRLQKENEEYSKQLDLDYVDKNFISKDKIKDFIVYNKEKIAANNKEIEECRKTIMEEQELKRLRLYTLHKDNDLLEREIADLFDLLKEE